MYKLIVLAYVLMANGTPMQMTLVPGTFSNVTLCETAGKAIVSGPASTNSGEQQANDERVAYICVPMGVVK